MFSNLHQIFETVFGGFYNKLLLYKLFLVLHYNLKFKNMLTMFDE